jgi:hypothetical protein
VPAGKPIGPATIVAVSAWAGLGLALGLRLGRDVVRTAEELEREARGALYRARARRRERPR